MKIDKIPKTADGKIIFPGMKVFICSPYSNKKTYPATIHHVEIGNECFLIENQYFNGEWWEDGNTENASNLYESESECLKNANEKWEEYQAQKQQKASKT